MGKYIDLCTVIDVEPEVSQVLGLIEDEDFFRVFVEDYCKDSDIRIIKKIIDEVYQEESEED